MYKLIFIFICYDKMNRTAIVFLSNDRTLSIEPCINAFLKNNSIREHLYCIHQESILEKVDDIKYISINPANYKYIEQVIDTQAYDYLVLLPNQYIIDRPLPILESIEILIEDICQVQWISESVPEKQIPPILHHPFFRYDSYKQIFMNPAQDRTMDNISYSDYIQKKYYTTFCIVPSIIDIRLPELKTHIPIFRNTYYQRIYDQLYLKNGVGSVCQNYDLSKNTVLSNIPPVLSSEVTVVTGFIRVNHASKKHKYDYVSCANKTLSLPNPMVIYISQDLYEQVKEIRKNLGLLEKTKIVILQVSDFYMYDQKHRLDQCCLKNRSPYNNSLYIMAVNSRYSYLEKAIRNNYFGTDYYAWVDFGLNHIVNMDVIEPITYNDPLRVKIAWIARKNLTYNHKCLGGGIYVAHRDTMNILCRLHDIEFRYNLSLGHCVNDDKTLFFIFMKYPELFDIYYSGYNCLYEKLYT